MNKTRIKRLEKIITVDENEKLFKQESDEFEYIMNQILQDYFCIDHTPHWTHSDFIPELRHSYIPEYKYTDKQIEQIEKAEYDEPSLSLHIKALRPQFELDYNDYVKWLLSGLKENVIRFNQYEKRKMNNA